MWFGLGRIQWPLLRLWGKLKILEIYLAFILHLFVSNCYVHASFMPFCFKSHPYMNEKLEQKWPFLHLELFLFASFALLFLVIILLLILFVYLLLLMLCLFFVVCFFVFFIGIYFRIQFPTYLRTYFQTRKTSNICT